ncbi:MAG: RagB/SusD family nutrient uptake outer membrane protein [Tamlana sp.]
MKNYKYILFVIVGLAFTNCNLEEEPPFLANENVFSTSEDSKRALTGIYASFAERNYYGYSFIYIANLNSGIGVTRDRGNNINSVPNTTLASLKPTSAFDHINNSWTGIYRSISRSNDAINSAIVSENPTTDDQKVINDVAGQAYFFRAFNYFNLVRMWGEVPLRLVPTTKEEIHLGKSSIKDVYAQIISDTKRAQELMNGEVGNGTVKPEAASMLLAKVYMTLAEAPTEHQEAGLNYWQMAYDEAKKVYDSNQYALVSNYGSLFETATSDNTVESIFEIQSSESSDETSLSHVKEFTPSHRYIITPTWGKFYVNVPIYDSHANTYPGDPRLASTYIGNFINQQNGSLSTRYPDVTWRSNMNNAFPYVIKLGEKDQSIVTTLSNKNFIVYRYSDLLLMLAEISNELQNGEQLGYVTEVLTRLGLTPQAGYYGDQESFRNAIMREYIFELAFEGHAWFNNRRRGYKYFLDHIITPHNTARKDGVDVTLDTNEANVMYLPIPLNEIDGNELIN